MDIFTIYLREMHVVWFSVIFLLLFNLISDFVPYFHIRLWCLKCQSLIECVCDADEALPFYEVLVGVLSARHHYELRRAIRETWLGYLRDNPHFHQRSVRWSLNFAACFTLLCLLCVPRPEHVSGTTVCSWEQIADGLNNTFIFTWPAATIVLAFILVFCPFSSSVNPSADNVWWPLR